MAQCAEILLTGFSAQRVIVRSDVLFRCYSDPEIGGLPMRMPLSEIGRAVRRLVRVASETSSIMRLSPPAARYSPDRGEIGRSLSFASRPPACLAPIPLGAARALRDKDVDPHRAADPVQLEATPGSAGGCDHRCVLVPSEISACP